jgi:MoaA/NifB/PqqE/SkfB family radical SAM enzyme
MKRLILEIDQDGNLAIPQSLKDHFRMVPGSKILVEIDEDRLHLSRPSDGLNRIYIEVTNQCNLDCSTCIRTIWNDSLGSMPFPGFQKIIADLSEFSPIPEIFFGGYGEPLSHPDILPMIRYARAKGASTSLITNGTLLSQAMTHSLIESGLDMLWVSIDGAHPESYQDVRLGNHLPKIIENLHYFHQARTDKYGSSAWSGRPGLGIAFVLMRKNAADLPAVIALGKQLGANQFFVTNLMAYTQGMAAEVLYEKSLTHASGSWEGTQPRVWLPRMDLDGTPGEDLIYMLMQGYQVKVAGNILNRNPYLCPFLARGATAVRWDGNLAPCLPLLYEHTHILGDWHRRSLPHTFGNLNTSSIVDLWYSPEYRRFREDLLAINFSPCVDCHTCNLSEDNLLDCTGYRHPNCGGCLWAHGVIQCP